MPATAPIAASSRLSVRSCRARRHRGRAQCHPHTQFSLPRGGARKLQIGHVRAHNQEQHEANGHQNPQRRKQHRLHSECGPSTPAANSRGNPRWSAAILPPAAARTLPLPHSPAPCATPGFSRAGHPHLPLATGLSSSHAPCPFSGGAMVMGIQISNRHAGHGAAKLFRRDAGYRQFVTVHADGPAHRARVALEQALPKPIADHRHRRRARVSPYSDGRNARPRTGFTPSTAK